MLHKFLILTATSFLTISLSAQNNPYEKGYYDGYCQAYKDSDPVHQYGPCPVLGTYPLPDPFKDSYQDGFSQGMKDFSVEKNKGEGDKALLDSYKQLSETNGFVDYSSAISKVLTTNSSTSNSGQSTTAAYSPPQNSLEQSDELLVNKLQAYNNRIEYLEFEDLYGFGSGTGERLWRACRQNGFKAIRTSTPFKITMRRPKKLNAENSLRVEMELDCVTSTIEGTKYVDCYYTTKVYNSDNELIYHNKSINGGTGRQVLLIRKAMRQ